MQRDNSSSYIEILKESLKKKISVLDQIAEQNRIQAELAKATEFDYDVFSKTLEAKEALIKQINALDAGFQSVFDRIKEALQQSEHKEEIKQLQALVKEITDKSMDIMAQEKRNKEAILNRKDSLKKEVAMARSTNKAAANYYRTMSKMNVTDSQFIDKKK